MADIGSPTGLAYSLRAVAGFAKKNRCRSHQCARQAGRRDILSIHHPAILFTCAGRIVRSLIPMYFCQKNQCELTGESPRLGRIWLCAGRAFVPSISARTGPPEQEPRAPRMGRGMPKTPYPVRLSGLTGDRRRCARPGDRSDLFARPYRALHTRNRRRREGNRGGRCGDRLRARGRALCRSGRRP